MQVRHTESSAENTYIVSRRMNGGGDDARATRVSPGGRGPDTWVGARGRDAARNLPFARSPITRSLHLRRMDAQIRGGREKAMDSSYITTPTHYAQGSSLVRSLRLRLSSIISARNVFFFTNHQVSLRSQQRKMQTVVYAAIFQHSGTQKYIGQRHPQTRNFYGSRAHRFIDVWGQSFLFRNITQGGISLVPSSF